MAANGPGIVIDKGGVGLWRDNTIFDNTMEQSIIAYNQSQTPADATICDALATTINQALPEAENKIWHAHPVWFWEGNPIVGYSKQKDGIRLMFWSGASFGEANLKQGTGKFKDASITYTAADQIKPEELVRWLDKAKTIQWDYKNLAKRKGVLEKLGEF